MRKQKQKDCSDSLTIHPVLKQYFGYSLNKCAARFKSLQIEALSPYGIIPQHMGILHILKASEPLNQASLGDEMGIDKATMVKLIDCLEQKKLVVRITDPNDRRGKLIQITPKGAEFLTKTSKVIQKVMEDFLKPLSRGESEVLKKTLSKLL